MDPSPHTIVVATDFSHPGSIAVERAIEFAHRNSAELHIVHVFSMPVPLVTAYEFGIPEPDLQNARNVALEKLGACEKRAAAEGVKVRTHLLEGPTDKAIVEFASEQGADWIVVGTHGHTGFKHVLLGSVAERVVRHAACSVLVVRDPAQES
jgi:nucleotide-binding universal stress UspA family protein